MSEQNDKEKKEEKIKITVDNEQTKILAEQLARKELELEKERKRVGYLTDTIAGKEVAEDHEDLASLKLKMYEKFNHNENFLHAQSKSELSQMVENHINEVEKKAKGAPSGTAPANAQQYGIKDDLYTHKFSSWGELLDTLTEKSKTSNEAKSYLDEYWRMAVQAMKSNQTPIPIPNRNDPENMPPLKDEHGYKVLQNPERDSDIQSLQARWRKERLKRMGIKKEEGTQ